MDQFVVYAIWRGRAPDIERYEARDHADAGFSRLQSSLGIDGLLGIGMDRICANGTVFGVAAHMSRDDTEAEKFLDRVEGCRQAGWETA
jgi:hypothetical protein